MSTNTVHTSGWPGSVFLILAGSVIMDCTAVRTSWGVLAICMVLP